MEWAQPEAADPEQQRQRRQAARPEDGLAEGAMVGACGLHRRIGPGAIEIG